MTDKIKLARAAIETFEWSSSRQAAQRRQTSAPGMIYDACPACGGVKPSDFVFEDWKRYEVGHSYDCVIWKFLEADK